MLSPSAPATANMPARGVNLAEVFVKTSRPKTVPAAGPALQRRANSLQMETGSYETAMTVSSLNCSPKERDGEMNRAMPATY
jgi:hypothetical protein